MVLPVYTSQQSSNGVGQLTVPDYGAGEATAAGLQNLGSALGNAGRAAFDIKRMQDDVNRQTEIANRQTSYLTQLDEVDQEFENDPDPATVAQRYDERLTKLQSETLQGLDPVTQAEFGTTLTRQRLGAVGRMRQNALGRQADGYQASLDGTYEAFTRRYATATSEADRKAIAGELDEALANGVGRGLLTERAAQNYRQSMAKTGDEALILRQMARNPAAAVATLNDPNQMQGLDPVSRVRLIEQARAADEEQRAAVDLQKARMDPVAGAVQLGIITDINQADAIFDRAIIPQESGGNPNAVSPKGALGVSQIMPDTAAGVATKYGIPGIANLSDQDLRKKLSADPALARQLGLLYFKDNLKTFNGFLPAAIAAYHAGPGGAIERAYNQAVEKYGATLSAAQFLEFVPDSLDDGAKKTKDYVRDIYARLGSSADAAAYSPGMAWRLASSVGNELDRQTSGRNRVLDELTQVAGSQADEYRPLLEQGYAIEPQRVAAIRGPLELAVTRGDAGAADKLRNFDEALQMAPIVRQAYNSPPALVAAEAAAGRAMLMTSSDVSPVMARRVEIFENVANKMNAAIGTNSVGLAMRQGIVAVNPVEMPQNLNDAEAAARFRQQAHARGIASDQTEKTYGARHFFLEEERAGAKAAFADKSGQERFDVIASLAQSGISEPAMRAAIKEMGGDSLSVMAAQLVTSKPDVARDVMIGGDLLKDDMVRPKIDKIKPALESRLGALPYPNPTWKGDIANAALAVYAAERGRNGALYSEDDEDGMNAAIERVTGTITTMNGVKLPLPDGISPGTFSAMMSSMTNEDLAALGGTLGRSGAAIDADAIRNLARLTPLDIGRGRFAVELPTGPVMSPGGKPFVLDLKALLPLVVARNGASVIGQQNEAARINELTFRNPIGKDAFGKPLFEAQDMLRRMPEPSP
jgi:soluble lytic murein transglycosylase-like protein